MEPHWEVQSVLFTPERIKVLPNCGSPEKGSFKRPYRQKSAKHLFTPASGMLKIFFFKENDASFGL